MASRQGDLQYRSHVNVALQPLDPTVRSGVIFYLTIIDAYYTILTFEAIYAINIIAGNLYRFLAL